MQETPSRAQRLEAIKRATANALATVAVGRGRLQAARTVKAHVQASILLIGLEQRAAYILHMGNYAAGVLQSTMPQPAPRSEPTQATVDSCGCVKDDLGVLNACEQHA